MDWRRPGNKSLSEPMMVNLLTHICITQPHWVNSLVPGRFEWNFRKVILKLISLIDDWGIWPQMNATGPLMISQHWFRQWLRAVRQQAITWSNVEPYIYVAISQSVNSLRPSDAYMRQWSNHHWFRLWLVALPAPSHYLNQCWDIVNWTLGNKLQWNLNRNLNIFIEENTFEKVVCEILFISSRPQCVESVQPEAL